MEHTPPFNITCVLFAGGKSSRMGQDKALLPFGKENSLAHYQYKRLKPLFKDIYIVSKEAKFDFRAKLILDIPTAEVYAPTAGFVTVFQELNDERLFILSVDTPFVTDKEIAKLLENDNVELDAVIAKTLSGSQPMCGIYHRSLLPAFMRMLKENNHRLGQVLKVSKSKFVMFEEEEAFANLNHPEEYEVARRRVNTR